LEDCFIAHLQAVGCTHSSEEADVALNITIFAGLIDDVFEACVVRLLARNIPVLGTVFIGSCTIAVFVLDHCGHGQDILFRYCGEP
jgi:hypothetical protein